MNKIEEIKKEKDGLDVLQDVPRYAREGWEAIAEGDRERLKWAGVFFRRQTPGGLHRVAGRRAQPGDKTERGAKWLKEYAIPGADGRGKPAV